MDRKNYREVIQMAGIDNLSYFTRALKKETGTTPGAFQQKSEVIRK